MVYQLASVVAAVAILLAYGALQTGRLEAKSRLFCLTNFAGSAVLTWVAIVDRRAGFILLEGIWAIISLLPLLRRREP